MLCLPFKFKPLKAKATPIALFFDGVCVGIPNKGTNQGATKTTSASLAWTHGKDTVPRVGAMVDVAMAIEGKATGEYNIDELFWLVVVCCVLRVVFVCDFFVRPTIPTL